MFNFFKKFKKDKKLNRGMTYVELIVVLSIFAVMSSIVLFNYGKFQAKVDIKNLANDIALKIVQAQKDAMSGKLPIQTPVEPWRPSYGVYFDLASNSKEFIYFTNTIDSNNNSYDDNTCILPPTTDGGECLDQINITKNDYISRIDSYLGSADTQINTPLSITFTRPNSGAAFSYTGSDIPRDYVQITVSSSDNSAKECIRVYPSGRIQISECPV